MRTVYRLYEEERCFGDKTKRKEISENRVFICEDSNMIRLVNYVDINGDRSKTYVILKYIEDDLRWRQIQKENRNGTFNRGDLTTTWYKTIYDLNKNTWKESMFRYDDEKIILYKL